MTLEGGRQRPVSYICRSNRCSAKTYLTIATEAAEDHAVATRGHAGRRPPTALLRDGNRRRRPGRGRHAWIRGDGHMGRRLLRRAVHDGRRVLEAELDVPRLRHASGRSDASAMVVVVVVSTARRRLPAVVCRAVGRSVRGRAVSDRGDRRHGRHGRRDGRAAVHRRDGRRLAMLNGRCSRANGHGGRHGRWVGARGNQRRCRRLLTRSRSSGRGIRRRSGGR